MPDVIPTIPQYPEQGIQAELDLVYLWNPNVANELIATLNELLEDLPDYHTVMVYKGSVATVAELPATAKIGDVYNVVETDENFCWTGTAWDNLGSNVDLTLYRTSADQDVIDQGLQDQINLKANAYSVYTKTEANELLAAKQDIINDLQAIRSGAAAGATAVQPGDLATVATSGSYTDLSNTPTLGTAAAENVTAFASAAQGALADTAVQPADLATVATTGDYDDLTNKPTIPAAQVNSDWNANSGVAQILNKPTLGTMAAESASDYTKTANLATVATTGAYSDLSGTPTIPDPTQVSTLPTASVSEEGKIYQFVGTTTSSYTNGYFYKCVSDGADPATYSWEAVEVQASSGGLPDMTGQRGKYLTNNGTTASWSNNSITFTWDSYSYGIVFSTAGSGLGIASSVGRPAVASASGAIAIGTGATAGGSDGYNIAIGYLPTVTGINSIAIGGMSQVTADNAIQIGGFGKTNADANTVKFGNNNGNFEIMSADGTIPEARLADTTNATAGQVLTLDSNLNAVWQAGGSGGGSVPTLTWYTVSTAGNTLTIADTSSAQLVKVYKNGLLLQPTDDYTISGTTLTTVSAMVVGDKITTEVF